MRIYCDRTDSPIGTVVLVTDGVRLCALDFADRESVMMERLQRRRGSLELSGSRDPCGFVDRLQAYFAGDLAAIGGIEVAPDGTAFQRRVWDRLRAISPGSVTTYGAIANDLGNPGASRAVGLANALNPIAIVIPCHRVVGSNRHLTGYAGGLDRKRWLLAHEGATLI